MICWRITIWSMGLWLIVSCKPTQPQQSVVTYTRYQISTAAPVDSSFLTFLEPYRQKMKKSMDLPIGYSNQGMIRKQPESAIGNFMADAMKEMGCARFGKKIDAAFVNFYGMRSDLPSGNINIGHIYELMPFDNLIVVQEMAGSVLQEFLDLIAVNGGWPQSGISFEIKDKKAIHVIINGNPLDPDKKYLIANSDFIANGGNDCIMLKNIPQQTRGYLLRDALIEYAKKRTANGKTLDASIENRVGYAN